MQTFANSVHSTISDLKGSQSLDKASQDAKSGLESATTELHDTLKSLGRPRTSDGKKAQTVAQDLSDELRKNVAAIEEVLTPPPSSPSDIASAFATIRERDPEGRESDEVHGQHAEGTQAGWGSPKGVPDRVRVDSAQARFVHRRQLTTGRL